MPPPLPPTAKKLLFSTLDDLVEAALDGNAFRTGIILQHIASSFPAIASSCSASEEHRVRAALALHPPHDSAACRHALTSLGFAAPPMAGEKRLLCAGKQEASAAKQLRRQAVATTGANVTCTPRAAASAKGPVLSSAAPAAGACERRPSTPATAQAAIPPTASPTAAAASACCRRPVFLAAITKKLLSFSSRAAQTLPSLRLNDVNVTATAIEGAMHRAFVEKHNDFAGYKRQLLRLLGALEFPDEIDDGLFVARVRTQCLCGAQSAFLCPDSSSFSASTAGPQQCCVCRRYPLHECQ
jgi:hypothetical protein